MEREVNVYWRELATEPGWGWGLLAAQIHPIMACLDIYLEAMGCIGVAPAEFPREKMFFRSVRYPNTKLYYYSSPHPTYSCILIIRYKIKNNIFKYYNESNFNTICLYKLL